MKAAETSALDLDCYSAAMKWTEAEVGATEKSLRTMYRQNGAAQADGGRRVACKRRTGAVRGQNPGKICWRKAGSKRLTGSIGCD